MSTHFLFKIDLYRVESNFESRPCLRPAAAAGDGQV
jgi:hypothetical protein